MDKLPPSDPLPDFSRFGAPIGGAAPDYLREQAVGRRAPEAHQTLVERWRLLSTHLDRVDADRHLRGSVRQVMADLQDLRALLDTALQGCQFDGDALAARRGDALLRGLNAPQGWASLLSPWEWRAEMRVLVDLAIRAGAAGLTTNQTDCEGVLPLPKEQPLHMVAAIQDRAAHLDALRRANPGSDKSRPGHEELCTAQQLLDELDPGDIDRPDALAKWRSALAGALCFEEAAFAAVRTAQATPSPAVRLIAARHDHAWNG
jgi:hypothetical protein